MKILLGVQGTGNGHLTRCGALLPHLRQHAEVDVLVSGFHAEIGASLMPRYTPKGLGFKFGKKGGINYADTFAKNRVKRLLSEIKSLPVEQYDLVINDFEPVSAWAARRAGVPVFGLSNQLALQCADLKRPGKPDLTTRLIMRYYAPVQHTYAYHYHFVGNNVFAPIIRPAIRNLNYSQGDYFVVYLPFYSNRRIAKHLAHFPDVNWMVFSKHPDNEANLPHVSFQPINEEAFEKAFARCRGLLCAAGFGTTSEALHAGKQLIVVPMKGQYEQKFNALHLQQFGAQIIPALRKNQRPLLAEALGNQPAPPQNYPDTTSAIAAQLINDFQAGGWQSEDSDSLYDSAFNAETALRELRKSQTP